MTHSTLDIVTKRIIERSKPSREAYLKRMKEQQARDPRRNRLGCANQAHGFAACDAHEKSLLREGVRPSLGIVTAYNDMLSAHKPFEHFPELIRASALEVGATAQVAGGVSAMCDGVIQGYEGMELSLMSRDVIALSTALALAHDTFDGVVCLGTCDKIVPGLLMGALSFAHLPVLFTPAGPMPSGLPNPEKAKVRERFAKGEATRAELLEAEAQSYHTSGTCTFYGTANSNQLLLEIMGLQLPGGSFVNPDTDLRNALTRDAVHRLVSYTAPAGGNLPMYEILTEKAIINGIVGLLASGGSTNHTIHLIAVARMAGIIINWQDMDELSSIVPLLCRIYPNGTADVNHFHAAGGMGFLIRELLSGGLLHGDARTISGTIADYTIEPKLKSDALTWQDAPANSGDETVLRPLKNPFKADGGIKLLDGNIGRAVIKTSAVAEEHYIIEAPAAVFTTQGAVLEAFKKGELDRDVVVVLPWQGPKACGMPELHKLTPALGVLLSKGYKVALLTDGRMSGASGKVPSAIHVAPEALAGGMIGRIKTGDRITINAKTGQIKLHVPDAELHAREALQPDLSSYNHGIGRELFIPLRNQITSAEEGATTIGTGI